MWKIGKKKIRRVFFLSKRCPAKTLTKDLKVEIEGTRKVMIDTIEDQRIQKATKSFSMHAIGHVF